MCRHVLQHNVLTKLEEISFLGDEQLARGEKKLKYFVAGRLDLLPPKRKLSSRPETLGVCVWRPAVTSKLQYHAHNPN